MTTLRRILLATAQEGPEPEIGPKQQKKNNNINKLKLEEGEENLNNHPKKRGRIAEVTTSIEGNIQKDNSMKPSVETGGSDMVGDKKDVQEKESPLVTKESIVNETKTTSMIEPTTKKEATNNEKDMIQSFKKVEQEENNVISEKEQHQQQQEKEKEITTTKSEEEKKPATTKETTLVKNATPPPPPPPPPSSSSSSVPKKRGREELKEEAELLKALRPPPRNASKKYSSKEKQTGGGAKSMEEEAVTWVQCERCQKWRDLPSSMGKDLPAHWYCSMNTWEPAFATCDAPQKDEGVSTNSALGGRRKKKRALGNVEFSGIPNTEKAHSPRDKVPSSLRRGSKKASQNGPKVKKRPHSNNLRPSISNMMSNGDDKTKGKKKNWNWVLCETCQQWRKLPPEVDVNRLPEKWYCYMNEWDKQRASCSAPQEADDTVDTTDGVGVPEVRKNAIVKLPEGVNLYGGQYFPVPKGRKSPPASYRDLIVNHYRHFNRYDSVASNFLNFRYMDSTLFVPKETMKGSGKHGLKKLSTTTINLDTPQTFPVTMEISKTNRSTLPIAESAVTQESTFRDIFNLPIPPRFMKKEEKSQKDGSNLQHLQQKSEMNHNLENDPAQQTSSSSSPSLINTSFPNTNTIHDNNNINADTTKDNTENDTTNNQTEVQNAREFIKLDMGVPQALLKFSKPWKRAGGWLQNAKKPYYCCSSK